MRIHQPESPPLHLILEKADHDRLQPLQPLREESSAGYAVQVGTLALLTPHADHQIAGHEALAEYLSALATRLEQDLAQNKGPEPSAPQPPAHP